MSYPVFMVPAGDVLPVFFDSFDGGTGASITLTGLAATDIEIYKDGSVTQRASDAGYTLLDTDGIDFDGITGIHGFSIDTGDNTDAGFYTVGAWFTVVVSAVTIDAQTVSFIACQFRLMAAESVAAKPKVDVDAWLGTAAATPTTAGVPEVDVTHVAGTAQTAGDLKASLNTIDDFIDTEISTLTTELAKVPKSDGTASWNATALAAIQSEANDALVAYDPPTKAELDSAVAPLALEATLATVDNLIDTEISTLITMLTGIVPVNGTIGATGNSTTALHLDGIAWADDGPNSMLLTIQDVSTGLYYSRWIEDFATTGDIATVATLPFTPEASVDKYWLTPVRADVTGGSGLDAAGVRAAIGLASANLDTQLTAIDDYLDTEVAAIKAKTDNLPAAPAATGDIPSAATIADAVWDEDATAHQTQGTFGQAIGDPAADTDTIYALANTIAGNIGTPSNLGGGATIAANLSDIEGQTDDIGVAGAGLTAIPWNAAWDAEVESEANDALVAQNLDHLVKSAVDTDFATTVHLDSVIGHLADAGTTATFDRTTDSAEAIQAAIDTIDNFLDTEMAAVLADTNELQTDWANGGRLDLLIDAILEDTGTTLQAEVDGIQADTEDIQTRLPAALVGGRIDATVDATGMETGAIDAILTRAMTESYNTDGSTMTVSQALYLITQRLTEFAISGTTVTVKKLDGTTTALTLTLDDGTSPTSSTRAT